MDLQVLVDDGSLNLLGQVVPHLVGRIRSVEQDGRARPGDPEDVLREQQPELVAGHKIGPVDEVRGPDLVAGEPQVRDGDRPGLLRVVDEVALGVQVAVLAHDLDGVLVGADGAVRAQPVEHCPDVALGRRQLEIAVRGHRQVGHVIDDADGEPGTRQLGLELVEDALDHRRGELLGREPVAATGHPRHGAGVARAAGDGFGQGRDDVEEERLAIRARFLRAVEHGDPGCGQGQRGDQLGGGERPVQPNGDDPHALPSAVELLDGLLDRASPGTHDHNDPVGLGVPFVLHQPVRAPGEPGQPVHRVLHRRRHRVVEGVDRLAGLEEHVRVLRRSAQHGVLGGQCPFTVLEDASVVDEGPQIVLLEHDHPVHLVGGAEPVEEVQEGNAGLQGGEVGDDGQVLRLLYRARGQHGEAGGPCGHHIRVVAKDRQGVRGDRAGSHVNDRRGQLHRRS